MTCSKVTCICAYVTVGQDCENVLTCPLANLQTEVHWTEHERLVLSGDTRVKPHDGWW